MHGVTRVEHEQLRAQVQAMLKRLSPADSATLHALLPALHHLRGGAHLLAAEILGLAHSEMVPDDDALKQALQRFNGPNASKALGKFLSKVAGRSVGPYYLTVIPNKRPDKDAAFYSVVRVSQG